MNWHSSKQLEIAWPSEQQQCGECREKFVTVLAYDQHIVGGHLCMSPRQMRLTRMEQNINGVWMSRRKAEKL